MDDVREIEIEPLRLDRLADLLAEERADRFRDVADASRRLLHGRVVWNVNATASGGGVAEMLQTLLSYVRGAGVDTRWLVLSAGPDFFTITKRIHNVLHGGPGDGGPLGDTEREVITETLASNLDQMTPRTSAGDVVLLHDPQTAGMVDGLRAVGASVVWRCHVGRDTPNALTEVGWSFLRPMIENSDAFIFSRETYAPGWIPPEKVYIIPPSIDPFSAKNGPLDESEVHASLAHAGLVAGRGELDQLGFRRRNGTQGTVRRHEGLVLDAPPPPLDARLVIQVSRWDSLKDMAGVLTSFADNMNALPDDVHLMLVGPEAAGISDDPEDAEVLAECRSRWRQLGPSQQRRVHLTCLPMDDVDENAHLVNALQRHASVIVQKSLVEGFGLTVTEAMWKSRPIAASAVGGIHDQIVDGVHGLLLRDPLDLAALATALGQLLNDADLSAQLGEAAHERAHDFFLGDRHLEEYVDLFTALLDR